MQRLVDCASFHEARRGDSIIALDKPFPYLGFVRSGVIGMTVSPPGAGRGVRRLRLFEAYAGSTFGEIALLDSGCALGDASVISRSASYALFAAHEVLHMLLEDRELFARLAAHAATRSRESTQRLVMHHRWPVVARVAGVLLPFCTDGKDLREVDPQLAEFTQQDIAAAAGCVKEAAARAIATLEAGGAVRRQHGHIRQANRTLLMRYSQASVAADPHGPTRFTRI